MSVRREFGNTSDTGSFLSLFRYNYGEPRGKRDDDLKDVILQPLNQSTERNPFILDKSQPYITEFTLRSGNQPSIVSYLNQTLKDLERFCTIQQEKPSPVVVHTALIISEFYFTQTAYMNLRVGSIRGFQDPFWSTEANQRTNFGTSVKRGSPALENMTILGTEQVAVSDVILSETLGTVHLLGQEHVRVLSVN